MMHSIFVVDDHPVMRRGYAALISRESDFEMCGEASSAEEALDVIGDDEPDLIIVDISLEGMSGIELIKHLQSQHPDLPVLVVSMHDETLYGERALHAGARGYVMKSEVDDVIIEAIRQILQGGFYLTDHLNRKILLQYTGRGPTESTTLEKLSDRELEVFELIGRGRSTRDIADALHVSVKTVQSHRSRIKQKLAIDNITELTRRAVIWVQHQN
jgi:DNA-binding NarL/FixJ family response regulator